MLNFHNFSITRLILDLKVSLDMAIQDLKRFSGGNLLEVTPRTLGPTFRNIIFSAIWLL